MGVRQGGLCLKLKGAYLDGNTFGGAYIRNFSVFCDFSGPVKPFVNSLLFYDLVNFEEKINAFM